MYWDHTASSDKELSVKKGATVGLVENITDDDELPKGYIRVSQWHHSYMSLDTYIHDIAIVTIIYESLRNLIGGLL